MQKVMLTNNPRNRRMLVFQLSPRASSKELPNKASTVLRYEREKNGTVRARRFRIQTPPVIRLASGETAGPFPLSVLRDKKLREATRNKTVLLRYVEADEPKAAPKPSTTRGRGKKAEAASE